MSKYGFQVFSPANMGTECDVCGVHFSVMKGGACAKCRRALCANHLYGSFFRRLLVDLGAEPVCVQCRTAGAGR